MSHDVSHSRWSLLLRLTVAGAIWPAGASADNPTSRFYDELRQRSLFSLVEADCLRRLESQSLDENQRGELILELSKSFAAHAWEAVGAEQTELWRQARVVISDWLSRSTARPNRELPEAQLALVDVSESEWQLAQFELRPEDRELRRRGTETIESAIRRLTELEKTLSESFRSGSANTAAGGRSDAKSSAALSPFERRALWQQVRWRLGLCRLVLGKFAEVGSPDRADALASATEWLTPLAGGPSDDRLTGDAQLTLAEVARRRGDLDQANKVLSMFEKSLRVETPESQRERFVIERAYWFIAKREPSEAAAHLLTQRREPTRDRPTAPPPIRWSAELAYTQVVVELAMWQVAADRSDTKLATDVWNRVTADVAELQKSEAGYWAARASTDWQIARETRDFGRDLAVLVRRARQAFAAGETDSAIQLFDEAIVKANRTTTDNDAAEKLLFELRDARATLLFQARRYADAADAFRVLAESPRQERSAAVHLLWAYSLGRLAEQSSSSGQPTEFAAALQSLRERYPDQSEASEAAWLLSQLAERDERFTDAIALLTSIAETHPRRDAASAGLARCYERELARLRRAQQPVEPALTAARKQLTPLVERVSAQIAQLPKPKPTEDDSSDLAATTSELVGRPDDSGMNSFESELLVRWSRLLLEYSQDADHEVARQLLASVIGSSRDRDWLNLAKQLQIVLLAGERRIDEAERLLDSLDWASPDDLLLLLDGLSSVAAQIDGRTQRFVAELQLRASRELVMSSETLTDSQRERLWKARAEAFAATGQPSQAIAAYRKVLEKSPRDTKLILAAAKLCERLDTPDAWQQAKELWRKLEALHKPGSPDWLDARWHVIRCCQKRNEQAEALKLLKVTRLLYPDLGNAAIKSRFDELDQR